MANVWQIADIAGSTFAYSGSGDPLHKLDSIQQH